MCYKDQLLQFQVFKPNNYFPEFWQKGLKIKSFLVLAQDDFKLLFLVFDAEEVHYVELINLNITFCSQPPSSVGSLSANCVQGLNPSQFWLQSH